MRIQKGPDKLEIWPGRNRLIFIGDKFKIIYLGEIINCHVDQLNEIAIRVTRNLEILPLKKTGGS